MNNAFNPLTSEEIDAVLVDFADAAQSAVNNSGTLAEWSARYPALVRDFGRIAAENWSQSTSVTPAAPETAATARFREIGRAALLAARPALAPDAAPMQSLLEAARERGFSRQALAARLSLPDTLLLKLHRRLIHAASIPSELVDKIAESVGRTTDEIAAYLQQPAQMPRAASFRSDAAPEAQMETFADALQTDPDATRAHKAAWLHSGSSGDAA